MATVSGTSVLGTQNLLNTSVAPSKLMSIAFTSQPLPPARRLGYFYLYQFKSEPPFQCYIVEHGLLRAPGELIPIRLALLDATWVWRLDATWNLQGFLWTATIA